MTMEIEVEDGEAIERDKIIQHLTANDEIIFKSQQRGEADLTVQQKTDIALDIFHKSKLNFLVCFGKYLLSDQVNFFKKYTTENWADSNEISLIVNDLHVVLRDKKRAKNRRYGALQELAESDYFSEVEMMKRNPLLYEHLVGQYLSADEKRERDRLDEGSTLVKVLMEGIERDDAEIKRREQAGTEDMDEDDDDSEESDEKFVDYDNPPPVYSKWGEFEEDKKVVNKPPKRVKKDISEEEQNLLKDEFVTSMYQSFLDGKDEDFDYDSVDNNEKYDNVCMEQCDEEDKYFDSEEPETVEVDNRSEESEDELDIYMSALNQNTVVNQLTKDLKKL